jgi:phosphoglycerate dehydrogenase-like enzyme
MQQGRKPRIVVPDDIGASFKSSPNIARLNERAIISFFNERPSNEEYLIERIRTAGIVLTFRPAFTKFPKHVLASAPDLRMICISGTGVEDVDLAEATARKIAVANVPGPSNRAVAEHCLALMFAAARSISAQDRAIRRGEWKAVQGIELGGKTLGIVGVSGISSEHAPRVGQV